MCTSFNTLHLGSVFTENWISVIPQRHYLNLIVKRHSFYHLSGVTDRWHMHLKTKKRKRDTA